MNEAPPPTTQSDYERGFLAGWRLAVEMAATARAPLQQSPVTSRCKVCGMLVGAGPLGWCCPNLNCPNTARAF